MLKYLKCIFILSSQEKNMILATGLSCYKIIFNYIIRSICKESQIIGCLNSLWWNKNMSLDKKSGQGKLWLNQWLAEDVKYNF